MLFDESEASEFPTEPTIVVGVVHPHGIGGAATKGTGWILLFSFETWRGKDGVLHSNELILKREGTREELDYYMNEIKPYEILAARIVFTESNRAQVLDFLNQTVDKDDPLAQRAAELLKPKTYEHEFFGTLTFDREIDWYRVMTVWAGKNVELNLSTDDDSLQDVLQVALQLWNDQTTWNQRILDFAVQEKLDLYNNGWRVDDDPKLTSQEFKSRISLESITLYPKGDFDFCFDDDYLFASHMIVVEGNLNDGPTRAQL